MVLTFLGAKETDSFSGWKKETLGMHLRGSEARSLIGCFCGKGFELIPGDAQVTTSHSIKIRGSAQCSAILWCSLVINKEACCE